METIIYHNNHISAINISVVPDIIDYLEYIELYRKKKIFDAAMNHKCMMLIEYKQIIKKLVHNELDRQNMNYDYDLFMLH